MRPVISSGVALVGWGVVAVNAVSFPTCRGLVYATGIRLHHIRQWGKDNMPINQPAPPRNVGILIFPDVEILDFCGPFEVFASTSLPPQTDGDPETRLFEVFTIAERAELVA